MEIWEKFKTKANVVIGAIAVIVLPAEVETTGIVPFVSLETAKAVLGGWQ